MRALVIGAGAIGQYVAARLQLAEHDSVLFARPDAAERLANGYALRADDKLVNVKVPVASAKGDAVLGDPFELAVIAVKTFSTDGAIESLRAIPACASSAVLVLQNGLGSEERCVEAFGKDRVIAGALTTAVEKLQPAGVIASRKGGLTISPLGSESQNWVIAAFEITGIRLAVAADWRALKWSKLCMNLLGNAVSAILDWTPAQVYADRTAFSVERRCLLETIAVMDKLSIVPINLIDFPVTLLIAAARKLPEGVLRPVLASRVARGRGDKLPSLLIDTRAHRRQLEVDALNGAVAARGMECGVRAPANEAVTRILDGITAGTINWDDYRGKPAALVAAIT